MLLASERPGRDLLFHKKQVSFVFFFRPCGVVCEAFYSLKNAQGSGRGRARKLRGRMSFAEGCGRGCW